MRVYLLLTEDGRHQFFGEVPEVTDEADPPRPGLRGWLERKRKRLATIWEQSNGLVIRTLRRLWDGLNRRIYPDEAWLVRLRSVASIEVRHPSRLTDAEARAAWAGFLDRRRRRHLAWLVFYAATSPWTILLGPLPGPNVVGYWFFYRTFRHLMVVLGLRRARRGRIPTTFHPAKSLDRPLGIGRVPRATLAANGAA